MTTEWRSVTDRFQTFIGNLQPSAEEVRRIASAASVLAARLNSRLRPAGTVHRSRANGHKSWPVDDFLLIGGHAKGTAIHPARVADMLYVMPDELRPRDAGGSASLLGVMAAALPSRVAAQEAPEGGWLWIRCPDAAAIRLAPCFRTGGDKLLVARPETHGGWLVTDPVSETARLHDADLASGGKATHLLMMLKSWRRHTGAPISSFELELLVCEFTRTWIYPRRSLLFYDWMIRDFFFWLAHQTGREILTPGGLEPLRLGHAWADAAEAAFACAQSACVRERENADEKALGEWQAIFGPAFSGETQVIPASAVARLGGPVATQAGI